MVMPEKNHGLISTSFVPLQMQKDRFVSLVHDLYYLKMHMSINDSYHKGMSASEVLCLQEGHSDISLPEALSDKAGAAAVPPD